MAEDNKDQAGFKVVDRRPFAADGTPREIPAQEDRRQESFSAAAQLGSAKSARPAQHRGGGVNLGSAGPAKLRESEVGDEIQDAESGFGTLVSYLYTTAMFQLGLMQGPGGERIPPDLPNARRTVDLLEVLQDKTQGNLTPAETKLLDDVLYDLRVTYVDVQERSVSKKR